MDGSANLSFTVSDAEYASIDWGLHVDDAVHFTGEDGSSVTLNWSLIGVVQVPGATPPPGTYPGWDVEAHGPNGAITGLQVDDVTKGAIHASLVADSGVIVQFTTLQGSDVKLPLKNVTAIALVPGEYVVPD